MLTKYAFDATQFGRALELCVNSSSRRLCTLDRERACPTKCTKSLHRIDRAPAAALVQLRAMSATESALRPREILTGGRVNGGIVRAHLKWVRDYRGDASVSKVLAMLPIEAGM